MVVEFDIKGEPYGKASPRARVVGNFAQIYMPKETKDYMTLVKNAFREKYGVGVIWKDMQPLFVTITAYFPIPKQYYGKKGLNKTGLKMARNQVLPTKKPDCDNISKVILDSLSEYVYADDAQVAGELVMKFYTKDNPRVHVRIEESHMFLGGDENGNE